MAWFVLQRSWFNDIFLNSLALWSRTNFGAWTDFLQVSIYVLLRTLLKGEKNNNLPNIETNNNFVSNKAYFHEDKNFLKGPTKSISYKSSSFLQGFGEHVKKM